MKNKTSTLVEAFKKKLNFPIVLILISLLTLINCSKENEQMLQKEDIPAEIQLQISSLKSPGEMINLDNGMTVEKKGDIYILESDMLLSEEQFMELKRSPEDFYSMYPKNYDPSLQTKAVIENRSQYKWPNGIVPYMVDGIVSTSLYNNAIMPALQEWQARTGIRFVPRVGQADYVYFTVSTVNDSYVGRKGGGQILNLTAGADKTTAMHEIGHVLGLWHEQSAPNRDNHIYIHLDNVDPEKRHNFNKYTSNVNTYGNFDFRSIMLYDSYAFAMDRNKPTMTYKYAYPVSSNIDLTTGEWKRNLYISNNDADAIKAHYGL